MARIEITFDDQDKMSNWVTRAMARGLLPTIAAVIELDEGSETFMVTDTRQVAQLNAKELPIQRPDPMADADTLDQRQALVWLVMTLLQEDDSLLALDSSNIDPASIELSGSDLIVRTKAGVPFIIQALPLQPSPS